MEMAQVGIELLMQLTLQNKISRVAPLFVSFRLVVTAVAFPRNHNMEGQRIPSISHTVDRHLNRLCHFLALRKLQCVVAAISIRQIQISISNICVSWSKLLFAWMIKFNQPVTLFHQSITVNIYKRIQTVDNLLLYNNHSRLHHQRLYLQLFRLN